VPVDRAFFTELAGYLRVERPPGCPTPECFVVLRGPTIGQPMTEAGLRRGCGGSFAPIGPARERSGSGLIGCGTFFLLCARVAIPQVSGHMDHYRPPSFLLMAAFQP
jgi:hypothetical protein